MSRNSTLSRVFGRTRPISSAGTDDADATGAMIETIMAAETIVEADAEGPDAGADLPSLAEDVRSTVTSDAINAIEADIASLIAAMSAIDLDGAAAEIDADDDEPTDDGAMVALLSELDRMWQADPTVGVLR